MLLEDSILFHAACKGPEKLVKGVRPQVFSSVDPGGTQVVVWHLGRKGVYNRKQT